MTLLGKDAFSVSFDELMERLFNVLMVEGHSGFISIIEETKQEDDEEARLRFRRRKMKRLDEKVNVQQLRKQKGNSRTIGK